MDKTYLTSVPNISSPRPNRGQHLPGSAPARIGNQTSRSSARSEASNARTDERPHTHRGAGPVPPLKFGGVEEDNRPTTGGSVSARFSARGTWRSETARRRYTFEDGNGRSNFSFAPHGISLSDSRTPILKNFDVICPQWVDNAVSESRTHTKIYYTDLLGAPPVHPPIAADATTWEVDSLKEFLLTSRPRTRMDAYPLLVLTQNILKRFANNEIKVVTEKEGAFMREIDLLRQQLLEASEERDALLQRLKDGQEALGKTSITGMLSAAARSAASSELHASQGELQSEREMLQSEREMMAKLEAEKKRLEDQQAEMERKLKEALAEMQKAVAQLKAATALNSESDSKLRAEKEKFDKLQAKMDEAQQGKGGKEGVMAMFGGLSLQEQGDVFITVILPNQALLASVGCSRMADAWTMQGAASRNEFMKTLLQILLDDPSAAALLAGLLGQDAMTRLLQAANSAMLSLGGDPASLLGGAGKVEAKAEARKAVGVNAESQTIEVPVLAAVEKAPVEDVPDAPLAAPAPAAPKKKKGPKYPAAGAKPMAPDSVIRLVHESFEAKIQADYKDDGAKRPRQDFVAFVKDFVVRKYGLKSIAMKHLGEIVASVAKYWNDRSPIKLFGLVTGMLETDDWKPKIGDFTLGLLAKICEIEGRTFGTISEWMNGDKNAGVSVEAATAALVEVSASKHSYLPAQDEHIEQIKLLPRNELGFVVVHSLLLWALDFLSESERRLFAAFQKVFIEGDKNGDGVLEVDEFKALIATLVPADSPLLEDREMMTLYSEVLGASEDQTEQADCITKEAFAEVALLRGLSCPKEALAP